MPKEFLEEKRAEFVAKLKEFLRTKYEKNLIKASNEEQPLVVDFNVLQKYRYPELADLLLSHPDIFFEIADEAINQIELPKEISPEGEEKKVKIRLSNLGDVVYIRDLRARHTGKFLCTDGIVRRASEIRPEISETVWECPECEEKIRMEIKGNFIQRPFVCTNPNCRNKTGFKKVEQKLKDTRWITMEEPFELTEGERPSQLTVALTDDLVSPEGRRMTDPGNRLKITGILREIPKGKSYSPKLDFYLEANHVEPVETGWEKLEISKEDEKLILEMAKDSNIYQKLVDSLAPSLYGMREIKESIILQLFGGVPRTLKDKTKFRGDIHILLVGDPSSGKSQLLKLVPQITPRSRYVSGKGVTGAGLTATVSKDEMFMGGWVLEAGALVLTNKGLLAIDEFEKMSQDDQVAMHEALEQGSISIAKASIVATLPAQTSVLAGGNPKFSRFDPYMAISKQITIPDTLLSRFDLKFALRDVPNTEQDTLIVDHVLKSRDMGNEIEPKIDPDFIKKYVAYAKVKCKPKLTKEAGRILRNFYLKTRKKAEGGSAAIPITLRQFEALIRLAEASAKIQLSDVVRKEDAERAINLMKFSLRQLGFDPETGQIDVDRSEGATTSTERSRIRIILDIINDLSLKKKEILLSELERLAKKDGVEDVSEIIDKLKKEGMLFEPSPGYVQKV